MYDFVVVSINDILIFSKTLENHIHHKEIVLQCLCKHKLYANVAKCEFTMENINFLRYVISGTGEP